MAAEARGAMFDEFVQGGLIDDADVTLKTNRFTRWDYNGTVPSPVLALQVKMIDSEGLEHDQYLSAGDLRFFVPSDDGRKAIPVGNQQKLNLNTNAVQFLISIMNADTRGEMRTKLSASDDIGILDGLKVHIERKAQPKRAGIIQAPGTEGQPAREKTVLHVTKILAYPWEGATTSAGATASATPTQVARAGNGAVGAPSDTEDKAVGILLSVLADNGGQISKTAIAGKAFNNADMKAEPAPIRNAILGMIVKPDFLGAEGRPWKFDGANVSLG